MWEVTLRHAGWLKGESAFARMYCERLEPLEGDELRALEVARRCVGGIVHGTLGRGGVINNAVWEHSCCGECGDGRLWWRQTWFDLNE